MGNEFGQFNEWNYAKELDWDLSEVDKHKKLHRFVKELNNFYLENGELWENDFSWDGFKWIVSDDVENGVIAFRRIDKRGNEIICVCNFCPVIRKNYRIGVPEQGVYTPVFNSDKKIYGGSGTRIKKVKSTDIEANGYNKSINICLPPLSTIFYEKENE